MEPLCIKDIPDLRNPTLVLAFSGWNDASSAATTAASYICQELGGDEFSKIISQAEKAGLSGQDIDIAEFIDRYYRNVAIDDLRGSSPADLAGAALSHLNLAVDRPPGKAKVRVYNPTRKSNGWASTHTIVEIVNDNMPFLVDSAGMAINRLGYSIHLTVHPTFSVTRDKKGELREIGKRALLKEGDDNESFLRIEIQLATGKFRRFFP